MLEIIITAFGYLVKHLSVFVPLELRGKLNRLDVSACNFLPLFYFVIINFDGDRTTMRRVYDRRVLNEFVASDVKASNVAVQSRVVSSKICILTSVADIDCIARQVCLIPFKGVVSNHKHGPI